MAGDTGRGQGATGMTRRKFLRAAAAGVAAGVSLGPAKGRAAGREVNAWLWEGYISPEAQAQFEKETGLKVNVSWVTDNGAMLSKLRAQGGRGVDLVNPTQGWITQGLEFGLYQPFDPSRIDLAQVKPALLEGLKNSGDATRDGRLYAVPLVWGTSHMLIYNREKVKDSLTEIGQFFQPKYAGRVTWRAQFHTLLAVGHWMFGRRFRQDAYKDEATARPLFDKILDSLVDHKYVVKKFWTSRQEHMNLLISGEAWLSMGWDHTAVALIVDGYPITAVAPKQGDAAWTDTLALPSGSENLDGAYKLANFLLRPDVAGPMALKGGFGSASARADEFLPEQVRRVRGEIFTPEVMANLWWQPPRQAWWVKMTTEYVEKYKAAPVRPPKA